MGRKSKLVLATPENTSVMKLAGVGRDQVSSTAATPSTVGNGTRGHADAEDEATLHPNGDLGDHVQSRRGLVGRVRGSSLQPMRIVTRRRNRSRSSTYVDIQEGRLTPPVRTGKKGSAWPDYEIDQLIAADIAGASEVEIRALVVELLAARKSLA
jgi:prophage regulatory protein